MFVSKLVQQAKL